MPDERFPPKYYVLKSGIDGRFDMRQTRYREQYEQGPEHPYDVIACGFTAQQMRDLITQYFNADLIDTSALE